MGNDLSIVCKDCGVSECIGRARHYKKEIINKKISKELLEKLFVITTKYRLSLDSCITDTSFIFKTFIDDILGFADSHKGHELWFIDEFWDEEKELMDVKQ